MEAETSEALSKAEIQHFNTNDLELILRLKDHTHRSSPCPVAKHKAKPQFLALQLKNKNK